MPRTPSPFHRSRWLPPASIVVCLLLLACFVLQPDACAAVTAIPPWCWFLFGSALTLSGISRTYRRRGLVAGAAWLVFALVCVEETYSFARLLTPPSDTGALSGGTTALRIVSLNCSGKSSAAAEVMAYDPDIVLLQESPGREALERLAADLFGSEGQVLWSSDTSIIARGAVLARSKSVDAHYVHATVNLSDGRHVEVISLRLAPPVIRYDLWSPSCWREHRTRRIEHREQIETISRAISALPDTSAIIAGGDFNAPAGDGALKPLRDRLLDTFAVRGVGWGSTALNDLPAVRVDQIWASRRFGVHRVIACPTRNSDHRLVIADLNLSRQ